jgi:hypothetical protein
MLGEISILPGAVVKIDILPTYYSNEENLRFSVGDQQRGHVNTSMSLGKCAALTQICRKRVYDDLPLLEKIRQVLTPAQS